MKKLLSLLIGLMTVWGTAHAQITYFDAKDAVIPGTFGGLFVDIETGALGLSDTAVPGWDVQFSFGGGGIFTNDTFQVVSGSSTDLLTPTFNLASNTLVGSALTFSAANTRTASSTHTGVGRDQFLSRTEGFLGFELTPEGGGTNYGWMRVTFLDGADASGPTGILHDWAYDTTGAGIQAGVVPEPGTYALIVGALSLVVVLYWRRKQASLVSGLVQSKVGDCKTKAS